MARRRIGETMAIADDETKMYLLGNLEYRASTLATELIDMAQKSAEDSKSLTLAELVEGARRVVAAYDAWRYAQDGV